MTRTTPQKPASARAKPAKTTQPKTAKPRPIRAYVVVRGLTNLYPTFTEPDRVFASEAAAQTFADACNRELRQLVNPFDDRTAEDLLEGGEKALTALVKKFPLPAPKKIKLYGPAYIDWETWWGAHYFDMTETQRDALWDALDQFNWYIVQTTTVE